MNRPSANGRVIFGGRSMRVALLSNPTATGNVALLPRIRSFCAGRSDVFHYEVEECSQMGEALASIARIRPKVIIVNGGDGTVQTALTELYNGGQFGRNPPPVAVLPNGKTNLIAIDLGAVGDPIKVLENILTLANGNLSTHVVRRELIALTRSEQPSARPVLGMFLGGAGAVDTILYCRNKIYPLGLPNGLSHVVTGIAVLFTLFSGWHNRFLPPAPRPIKVSLIRGGVANARFSFVIVTTLEKLLLKGRTGLSGRGLRLMAVDNSARALLRAILACICGKLGNEKIDGLHVEQGNLIRIEGEDASVILDGEIFRTGVGQPIILRPTPPMSFLRIAA
jgi:Diacylglycerol kinase catalytic domain